MPAPCAGSSTGLAGPHTLSACAGDLSDLCAHLRAPLDGIIGHSLGGKIALRWLDLHDRRPFPRLDPMHTHDAGRHAPGPLAPREDTLKVCACAVACARGRAAVRVLDACVGAV